jgi:hypothetical protein
MMNNLELIWSDTRHVYEAALDGRPVGVCAPSDVTQALGSGKPEVRVGGELIAYRSLRVTPPLVAIVGEGWKNPLEYVTEVRER